MILSVLDQSTASKDKSQDTAIRETLELARHCDALGYHRFWVSEHHNSGTIVGTAPEIVMAAIAATTQRIRIGSAGVMLPHYSALKVAEQFRVLEAIAPGRIDLGIGRAPGSDYITSYALNPNPQNVLEQFPRQVQELQNWVSGKPLPEGHPFRTIVAQPTGPSSPELWILGSSDYGAQLAAYFGLPYAFAYFFSEGTGVEQALDLYRTNYRPSEKNPKPIATICVWALAADTEEEALHQFKTRERAIIDRKQGIRLPLMSPEEAERSYSAMEIATAQKLRRKAIVGSSEHVAARLNDLAKSLQLDELVIVTWTYDSAPRRRSYELLADAFALEQKDSNSERRTRIAGPGATN
ncbi:MAG TPA: LLM class flavin-dependent oxidoreductase [Candidatus Acidoferrales bacterium]|nr:LLM class flavin-dependent oxidoreductase [Candidatus Acidoferrales bacterium]